MGIFIVNVYNSQGYEFLTLLESVDPSISLLYTLPRDQGF